MITPDEIKARALKYWQDQRCLKAYLGGAAFFPLVIPFRKPSAKQLLSDFAEVRRWVLTLRKHSKEQRGHGYTLVFKEAKHRQLGEQSVPYQIRFDTPEDYYKFIGKHREFTRLQALVAQIEAAQPALRPWMGSQPLKVLGHENAWPQLLAVAAFFQASPKPDRYLRELDIPGVDSKFVEQHKTILRDLLDRTLPQDAINDEVASLAGSGFEQRYGLKYDEPLIRFRVLDPKLSGSCGVSDLSAPLGEFHALNLACRRVFITENKINGLSFPRVSDSIVIFGLGYGISVLKECGWLRDKALYYWGDIDTHGFAMLSRVRSYFPETKSFLMDRETLLAHQPLWGREESDKRFEGALDNLTSAERALYTLLKDNMLGQRIRLEQERIQFIYVRLRLQNFTED